MVLSAYLQVAMVDACAEAKALERHIVVRGADITTVGETFHV
jgi:hypothetical protein